MILQQDLKQLGILGLYLIWFNPSTCVIMTITRVKRMRLHKLYTMEAVVLSHVQEAKYLGILITDDLIWTKHTQANSIIGLLCRNLHHTVQPREQAFISLIRSHLEYRATAWDPHLAKAIKAVEMIQRRGAKFVKQNYDMRSSVTSLLHTLVENK